MSSLTHFFHSHILFIRKACIALSTKCTHNPATSDYLHYYPQSSVFLQPAILISFKPKRFHFVVSRILCYLLSRTCILLFPPDHSNWASLTLEQARCVPTLCFFLFAILSARNVFPQIVSWLILSPPSGVQISLSRWRLSLELFIKIIPLSHKLPNCLSCLIFLHKLHQNRI